MNYPTSTLPDPTEGTAWSNLLAAAPAWIVGADQTKPFAAQAVAAMSAFLAGPYPALGTVPSQYWSLVGPNYPQSISAGQAAVDALFAGLVSWATATSSSTPGAPIVRSGPDAYMVQAVLLVIPGTGTVTAN
jgi:hypothetical protein